MADCTIPNGPASPETPICIWLAGSLGVVDLARRLARGGLELTEQDGKAVLVLADRTQPAFGALEGAP